MSTSIAQRIIPVLDYADIAAAQEQLVTAFGFERGRLDRDGDGRAVHADVSLGGQMIWLHRVTEEHGMHSQQGVPTTGGLEIVVDDVDAHHARARGAGADLLSAPRDQPYGMREYGARDLEGRRWYFATPT